MIPTTRTATPAELRRELQALHNELRNRGLSPVEALSEVAAAFRSSHSRVETDERSSELLSLAFQQFISDDARATFGQYLTPPFVAEHLVGLIEDTASGDVVLDPFAGSGILLEAAARRLGTASIGYEINPAVAEVARTTFAVTQHALDLHVDDAFRAWLAGDIPLADAVVVNPPFGAHASMVEVAEFDDSICAKTINGNPPVELLGLELCLDRVKPGGLVAAVLPTSVLTNRSWAAFRSALFSRYKLEHVTALPDATFIPFKGVARSVVVLIRNVRSANARPSYLATFQAGYDSSGRPSVPCDVPPSVPDRGALPTASVTSDGEFGIERHSLAHEVTYRLGDIAEVIRGKNPKRDGFCESGPFLLKVGSLAGSFISWRDRSRSHVPTEWFERAGRAALRPGDVCFTGTAHRPNYIGLKVDLVSDVPIGGAVASGEVVIVRLRDDAPVNPIGLLYYLRSAEGYAQIQGCVRGSSAHVYPQDLAEIRVPVLADVFDMELLVKLHLRAEEAFREYLAVEDQITESVMPHQGLVP